MLLFLAAMLICVFLASCADLLTPPPPKPSLWQLESECAAGLPMAQVEGCTRNRLDNEYGNGWHAVPQANVFVDFVGTTAEQVQSGALSEAQGKLAVSNFASQQQTERAADEARRSEALGQLGLTLLQNAGPCPIQHSALTPCPAQLPAASNGGFSVTAALAGVRPSVSVTGQPITICTYQYGGTRFDRYFPAGSVCPMSVQAQ